jgi:hypothetical protein
MQPFFLPLCMTGTQVVRGAWFLLLSLSPQPRSPAQRSAPQHRLAIGQTCEYGRYDIRFAAVEGHGLSNTDGSISVTSGHQVGCLMVSTVDPANDSDLDGMNDDWNQQPIIYPNRIVINQNPLSRDTMVRN